LAEPTEVPLTQEVQGELEVLLMLRKFYFSFFSAYTDFIDFYRLYRVSLCFWKFKGARELSKKFAQSVKWRQTQQKV
jgi:hypothetical protein